MKVSRHSGSLRRLWTVFPTNFAAAFDYVLKDANFNIPFLLKEREETIGIAPSFSIDLAKWGDKPLDGDYQNLQARAGWARARIDAAAVAAH